MLVGERVTIEGSDTQYVILAVNHATGHAELLRLNTGRIENNVPLSNLKRKSEAGGGSPEQ